MKTIKYLGILVGFFLTNSSFAQVDVREDNYVLRSDTGLNYNLYVRNNDTPFSNIKIFELKKIGNSAGNYTAAIIDSSYIIIASNSPDTFGGQMIYKGKDNQGNIDSTNVRFIRTSIPPSVRPGDANKDNLVNHLDLFPIGLLFERRGDGRHNLDTNANFNEPKRIADWSFGTGGINGKYADIDGNSVINQTDFLKLKSNLGLSFGAYTPKLSDTISMNTFKLDIKDTVLLTSLDSNKIKVPVKLLKSGAIPSYGLGFTVSLKIQSASGQDTFFNKYRYILPVNGSLWTGIPQTSTLFLEDKISKPNHTNLAFSKANGFNGDIKEDIGVVEIIVDEILIGQVDKEKMNRIHVYIDAISWIDNNYNTISVRPISKYIYFKNAKSSILSAENNEINVYPTIVNGKIIIESPFQKSFEYSIYNSLGQLVTEGKTNLGYHEINSIDWSTGVYYLQLNVCGKTFRLIKE